MSSGADVAGSPAPDGFEVNRVVLYEARQADALPELGARRPGRAGDRRRHLLLAARVGRLRTAGDGGRAGRHLPRRDARSPSARRPPSRSARCPLPGPSRQSVPPGRPCWMRSTACPRPAYKARDPMTDTSPPPKPRSSRPSLAVDATIVPVRRGLGVARRLRHRPGRRRDRAGRRRAVAALLAAGGAKLCGAAPLAAPAAACAAPHRWSTRPSSTRPSASSTRGWTTSRRRCAPPPTPRRRPARPTIGRAAPDPAIAELRRKVEALESKPQPEADTSALKADTLGAEIRDRRPARGPAVARPDRRRPEGLGRQGDGGRDGQRHADEQKALAAARGSAVIGVAARISAALTAGLPFATDLALLRPLARGDDKGDAKLDRTDRARCSPWPQRASPRARASPATFPAMAKAAMADDLADNSFWQRLLGKLKSVVSLRRVGADVEGDSVEAKLARAEAAAECRRPAPRRSSW